MDLLKTAGAALAGTTAMTAFSYAVSDAKNKQFREPEILAKLVRRLFPMQDKATTNAEGWALHYGVGTGFAFVYDQLFRRSSLNPTLANGAALGAVSGLVGTLIWNVVLKLHPHPPKLDVRRYTGHLLIAHVVYGVITTGMIRKLRNADVRVDEAEEMKVPNVLQPQPGENQHT